MDKQLEHRLYLLENVMDAFVRALGGTQPSYIQEQLDAIYDKWDIELDKLKSNQPNQ